VKVFLDTNVLVSAIATRGLCADVMREVLSSHLLVISAPLLDELRRILTEKIVLPENVISDFIDLLQQDAIQSTTEENVNIDFQDSDGIPILSSALNGGTDFFVTGDKALLKLGKLSDMSILSPREFWENSRTDKNTR
jgi:uncharacterized protein